MLGPNKGIMEGATKRAFEPKRVSKEGMSAFLEHKKQLWKSIKHQFIESMQTTSTTDSIATASATSDCDSNLGTDDQPQPD